MSIQYTDLRDFMRQLEALGQLKRIAVEVDPRLEMTEISDRVLRSGGPALLFEKPKGHSIPVLANLFGTPERVALGVGADGGDWKAALREVGELLAFLKEPEPPKGLRDAWEKLPVFKQVLHMAPKLVSSAPCQLAVILSPLPSSFGCNGDYTVASTPWAPIQPEANLRDSGEGEGSLGDTPNPGPPQADFTVTAHISPATPMLKWNLLAARIRSRRCSWARITSDPVAGITHFQLRDAAA